jgi:hypothetical protein
MSDAPSGGLSGIETELFLEEHGGPGRGDRHLDYRSERRRAVAHRIRDSAIDVCAD